MNKLINSVDGAVTEVLGGETGAPRGRAHGSRGAVVAVTAGRAETLGGRVHRTPGAAVAVPADGAAGLTALAGRTRRASVTVSAGLDAAHPARTADDADRPEITRSWGAPVNTPALRWER